MTALSPHVGYANATDIAEKALRTGREIPDLVLETGLLDPTTLQDLLSPEKLTGAPTRFPLDSGQ